ncbi:hypothetical protein K4L44_12005 [Halosquirtibacter laminarini]|uniref:Uncharacterized protein n=1 Tax=Halosquirtibacter laminarini TaxID=3374600 RepID=A0AC61NMX9_9BACT|nr:hypothetical protein K4L44_12005 [Prolixibacteraceae bacterium]
MSDLVYLSIEKKEFLDCLKKQFYAGHGNGVRQTLIELGLITADIRKAEAKKLLGCSTYDRAVEKGYIVERKLNPEKRNSSIVVSRSQVFFVRDLVLEGDGMEVKMV